MGHGRRVQPHVDGLQGDAADQAAFNPSGPSVLAVRSSLGSQVHPPRASLAPRAQSPIASVVKSKPAEGDFPTVKSPHGSNWWGECAPQPWLGDERDGCGVGFIAQQSGERSHGILKKAIRAVGCMEHRGGCLADGMSGDGAGIMAQVPWDLLHEVVDEGKEAHCGVGQIFMPLDEAKRKPIKEAIERVMKGANFKVLGWRDVPVEPSALGKEARENMPFIQQLVVESPDAVDDAR